MLNLFLKFLSYIVNNLIGHVTTRKDENTFQQVFHTYMLINRMTSYLEEFSAELAVWQKDRCHGGAWSDCQRDLQLINHAMHLLDADLIKISGPLDSEEKAILRSKIRGGPIISKPVDTFDIWVKIIEQNAVDYFCGWVSDHSGQEVIRTIYIPKYSLLLPNVRRTSELSDFNQSQWRLQLSFEHLNAIGEKLNYQAMTLLPELPAELPIDSEKPALLKNSFYAKRIIVPKEEQELIEIINGIQRQVAEFRGVINSLRDVLIAQTINEPEKIIKLL